MRPTYCERLGIPVPRVEDHLPGKSTPLLHTMVVALLEHGSPMTLEALEIRLAAAGVRTAPGLRVSLQKAWAGREPLVRRGHGAIGLMLRSHELDFILMVRRLEGVTWEPLPEIPEPPAIADTVPLAADELATLLGDPTWRRSLSDLRVAAAVLSHAGRPMTAGELDRYVTRLVGQPLVGLAARAPWWAGRLVKRDAEGRLILVASEDQLRRIRREVRAVVSRIRVDAVQLKQMEQRSRELQARDAERRARIDATASRGRKPRPRREL